MTSLLQYARRPMILVLLFAVLALATAAAVGTLSAAPAGPKITGGGVSLNNNAFVGLDGIGHGGFNAKATADLGGGIWEARGNFQAKSVFTVTATGDPFGVSRIHADVVCIAALADDVWEMRIHITKSTFNGVSVDSGIAAVGTYGSIFVRGNGRGAIDEADENFSLTDQTHPDCRLPLSFGLEPSLGGNVTVHS